MNRLLMLSVAICLPACLSFNVGAASAQEVYELMKESMVQKGVPQGELKGPFEWKSDIFPGTVRSYSIYVPAQYDAKKPACTLVVQDGLNRARGWKIPTILDNMIHAGEVPVTVGIFISPGIVPPVHENAQGRFNRSFEYDSMGDRYARFLLEEILPEVEKSYNLSHDPNDRAIAGSSSGAICAFNVAWERPDAFRRVISTVGTYTGLRGAHEFPVLVRKHEPKPIRIAMQDGSNDLDIYAGSWWFANQDMLSSFKWAGYDVKNYWGEGGHNAKQSTAIMPDLMRWIWRDYPAPVKNVQGGQRRTDILIDGEDWEEVASGYSFTEGPAVNAKGEVFFTDIPSSRIMRIDLAGKVTVFAEDTGKANGLMFGPDGRLFACANGKQQIVAYDESGKPSVVVSDTNSNDLVVMENGIFYTDPGNKKVHFATLDGKTKVVDTGIQSPNGIALSTDQTLLWVGDVNNKFIQSFQVQADGALKYKQNYGHLHIPYEKTGPGADGMTVDDQGRLYVATQAGVQVCDQLGRVHVILKMPQRAWLANVVFGGPEFDVLYATSSDKVFRRKLKAKGVQPWRSSTKPPKPRL